MNLKNKEIDNRTGSFSINRLDKIDNRLSPKQGEKEKWSIKGELILNCNCTVFCPCVVSLGDHPPTEGYCQAWLGVRIDNGQYGKCDLSNLNVAMIMDIPGKMARGNWKAAIYVDNRASDEAFNNLVKIFSGKAKGTTGLFSILVSEFLGAERSEIIYETIGDKRNLIVGKNIIGSVKPIVGNNEKQNVEVKNTKYWMGPNIIIAEAEKGRVRAFGRVWDFNGRSAEICKINWEGLV